MEVILPEDYMYALFMNGAETELKELLEDPQKGKAAQTIIDTITPLPSKYKDQLFNLLTSDVLSRFIATSDGGEQFDTLLKSKMLPTPRILETLESGESIDSIIEDTKKAIEDGTFDKNNPLHMEIHYADLLANPDCLINIGTFEDMCHAPALSQEPYLTAKDLLYCKRTAYEAQDVFNMIKRADSRGREKLVISNLRYGQFVITPDIKKKLESEGVKVEEMKISSLFYNDETCNRVKCHFTPELISYINAEQPDVFVVDGTDRSETNSLARFPGSFIGYFDTFRNIDTDYSLDFWSAVAKNPDPEDVFTLGHVHYNYSNFPIDDSLPKVTLMQSASNDLHCGSRAYFDDVEEHLGLLPMITPYGVEHCRKADCEADFVKAVQKEMAKYLKLD